MGALAGFVLGYYLGMKQGPEGYAQFRQALDALLASPEAKGLLERLPFLGGGGNGARSEDGQGGEQLVAIIKSITESEAIQSMLAGGLNFARGLIEKGMAGVGARS